MDKHGIRNTASHSNAHLHHLEPVSDEPEMIWLLWGWQTAQLRVPRTLTPSYQNTLLIYQAPWDNCGQLLSYDVRRFVKILKIFVFVDT